MSRRSKQYIERQEQRSEMMIQEISRSFSGPLPPPEALAAYNEVLPNAAERITAMAESQHDHRQNLELTVVNSNVSSQRLGVILGFVIALTIVGGGMVLIVLGKPVSGLVAIITAVTGLVSVFIIGKKKQRKDLDEKAPR